MQGEYWYEIGYRYELLRNCDMHNLSVSFNWAIFESD